MTSIERLNMDAIAARWPRLIRAMRWTALLNEAQAQNVVYCYKCCNLQVSADAQIIEMGGNLAVIRAAVRGRHRAAAARRLAVRNRVREVGVQALLLAVTSQFPGSDARLPDNLTVELVMATDSVIDFYARSAA